MPWRETISRSKMYQIKIAKDNVLFELAKLMPNTPSVVSIEDWHPSVRRYGELILEEIEVHVIK